MRAYPMDLREPVQADCDAVLRIRSVAAKYKGGASPGSDG